MTLAVVSQTDAEFLYLVCTNELSGLKWRVMGAVPTREVFMQLLWAGVLAQFVVRDRQTHGLLGLVTAYNADLHHGYSFVTGAMKPELQMTGMGVEAYELFCSYLFATWNLRKLYFDLPSYAAAPLRRSMGSRLKQEGCLPMHYYFDGRHWDRLMLALYREDVVSDPGTDQVALGSCSGGTGR